MDLQLISPLLGFTDGDVWTPGIGDPTLMGWLTVLCYFIAAGLCARVTTTQRRAGAGDWLFWLGATIVMAFLGLNKQLDLQSWLTISLRRLVISEGWYEHRRILQTFFIIALAFASAAVLWGVYTRYQEILRRNWQLCAGILFIMAFVLIRASSFHHVDQLLGLQLGGFKMNWALELSGILFLAHAALQMVRPVRVELHSQRDQRLQTLR